MTHASFYVPISLLISINCILASQPPTPPTVVSLYNDTVPVVQLDGTNFKSTVNNKSNAWIIEFYNSWCGHCIKFAPVWVEFAYDVKDWKNVINVAAINCAEEVNVAVCREYNVQYFPYIKFFRPYSNDTDYGITKSDVSGSAIAQTLKTSSIDFLDEINWPDLDFTKVVSIEELKTFIPSSINNVTIIVETNTSYLGREVYLGLYDYSNVTKVIRISDTDNLKSALNIPNVPFVGIFTQDLKLKQVINISLINHKTIVTYIKQALHLGPIGDTIEQGSILADKTTHVAESAAPDQVFMVDLENSISFTLLHEIQLHQFIDGDKLQSLKSFIQILIHYFPARVSLRNFLIKFDSWMEKLTTFTIEDFQQFRNQIQSSDTHLPVIQDWVTCKGSRQGLRGYPCSLWLLFHTLTTAAYNSHTSTQNFNPLTVPEGIANYIKHYFSCVECRNHFTEMAATLKDDINQPEDTMLWFWKAHNQVNARLEGEASEDPLYKKIQFPSSTLCATCKFTNGEWDINEVRDFLSSWYSESSINMTGVSSPTFNSNQSHHSMRLLDFKIVDEPIAVRVNQPTNTWSFSTLDMSLCLTLYICSAIILLSVYFIIIVKRRLKRKYQKIIFPFV